MMHHTETALVPKLMIARMLHYTLLMLKSVGQRMWIRKETHEGSIRYIVS